MKYQDLIIKLYEINAVKFGEFKLKSGIISPYYLDLKIIVSYPEILKIIAEILWDNVRGIKFDLLCGVPYTALPIATAISLEHGIPMIMRRKEFKDYGAKKPLEGAYQTGQTVLIIEDLVTSGISVLETIEAVKAERLIVKDVSVLIDREQGGPKHLAERDLTLHAAFTISEMLTVLEQAGKITGDVVAKIKNFIATNQT